MECGKAASNVRKVKKKQVKDEMDRMKQAEKKKRRLEKALAASAAIISELEKKNQKKKEEQQRLDEECAKIAEDVALQVLMDEDPWGSSCGRGRTTSFDVYVGEGSYVTRTAAFVPRSGSPNGGDMAGWFNDGYGGSRCQWNGYGYGSYGYDVGAPYVMEQDSEAALIAAQAVASLQIADDGVNAFVFNRMLRG